MTNLNCWTNPSETISISYCSAVMP